MVFEYMSRNICELVDIDRGVRIDSYNYIAASKPDDVIVYVRRWLGAQLSNILKRSTWWSRVQRRHCFVEIHRL